MADFKLDQLRPVTGRTLSDRVQLPAKNTGADFTKALEDAQKAPDMAALKARTQAVVEQLNRDEAQFNELMKAGQLQAKLIQSMMNRKPDPDA
jgi:hypothetical protein